MAIYRKIRYNKLKGQKGKGESMEYFNQWALYSYVDKWIIKDYSHIIYVHRHKYGRKYAMFMRQDQNITTKKAL